MATIRFRDSQNKVLFDYPRASALSDDADRIVFLSRRDFYLLLNSIEFIGKFRNRVYTSHIGEMYEICSDEQWSIFRQWVEELETNLGGWAVSNEYLERIAIAAEEINAKTAQLVTIDEVLEDISTVFGITHPLYLIYKWVKDLVPSLQLKIPVTDVFKQVSEVITWRLPLLSLVGTIASSLVVLAAAAVGQKIDKLLKDLQDTTANIWDLGGKLYEFVTESWSWFGNIFKPILDEFIPDEEGGAGGDNPDDDPDNRTTVNVATNITLKALLTCDSCGGNGHSCSCGGGIDTGGDVTDFVDVPDIPEGDREGDPPTGYPTWEDFDDDKCKRIKHFLDNYISTLRNIGGLFGMAGGLTIAVIAGLLLITVPPAGIAFVLSALALLVIIDIGLLVHFSGIADYLDENIDELVCAMEGRDSTAGMIEEINSMVNTAIGTLGLFSPEIEGNLEAATEGLLSNAGLAYILESQSVPEGYESYTCPCGAVCGFQLYDPLEVGDDAAEVTIVGNHVTILPAFVAGRWSFAFQFSTPEVPNACGRIDNISVTNFNHVTYNDNYIECGGEGFAEFASGSFEEAAEGCYHAILGQGDPNDGASPGVQPTIEFDIVECCEPEP